MDPDDKVLLLVKCLGAGGGLIGGAWSGTILIVAVIIFTGSTFGLTKHMAWNNRWRNRRCGTGVFLSKNWKVFNRVVCPGTLNALLTQRRKWHNPPLEPTASIRGELKLFAGAAQRHRVRLSSLGSCHYANSRTLLFSW